MPPTFEGLSPVIKNHLMCRCLLPLLVVFAHRLHAQVNIPETSGFGGFVITGPGYFSVASNLLVTGPPLTQDTGTPAIGSIFDRADANGSFAFAFAGEIHYTFAKSRTQIFFGNGLEDLLRLDVPVGVGVRQQLKDNSMLTFRVLRTPLTLKFWEDPYVENQERERTEMNFNGFRVIWARMFHTDFTFTATIRKYKLDDERSGDWLISEGRLNPADQPLLSRNGYVYRFQLLYQINLNQKHILRPAISYINDNHKGGAIANQGYALKLNYLRRSPSFIFDADVRIGQRFASEEHPVYSNKVDSFRIGAKGSVFIPLQFFDSNRWSFWASADYMTEDSQIDFFDSRLLGIMGGLVYQAK